MLAPALALYLRNVAGEPDTTDELIALCRAALPLEEVRGDKCTATRGASSPGRHRESRARPAPPAQQCESFACGARVFEAMLRLANSPPLGRHGSALRLCTRCGPGPLDVEAHVLVFAHDPVRDLDRMLLGQIAGGDFGLERSRQPSSRLK
jgi:hypothetical protein